MGELGADTAVRAVGEGRYAASLSRDWVERWPPPEPLQARCRQWFRFTPDVAEPDNRYLDAGRLVASGQSQLLCRPIPPN